MRGAAPSHTSLALVLYKAMEASHFRFSQPKLSSQRNLASALIQLRDLCPRCDLEVSGVLLPKKYDGMIPGQPSFQQI